MSVLDTIEELITITNTTTDRSVSLTLTKILQTKSTSFSSASCKTIFFVLLKLMQRENNLLKYIIILCVHKLIKTNKLKEGFIGTSTILNEINKSTSTVRGRSLYLLHDLLDENALKEYLNLFNIILVSDPDLVYLILFKHLNEFNKNRYLDIINEHIDLNNSSEMTLYHYFCLLNKVNINSEQILKKKFTNSCGILQIRKLNYAIENCINLENNLKKFNSGFDSNIEIQLETCKKALKINNTRNIKRLIDCIENNLRNSTFQKAIIFALKRLKPDILKNYKILIKSLKTIWEQTKNEICLEVLLKLGETSFNTNPKSTSLKIEILKSKMGTSEYIPTLITGLKEKEPMVSISLNLIKEHLNTENFVINDMVVNKTNVYIKTEEREPLLNSLIEKLEDTNENIMCEILSILGREFSKSTFKENKKYLNFILNRILLEEGVVKRAACQTLFFILQNKENLDTPIYNLLVELDMFDYFVLLKNINFSSFKKTDIKITHKSLKKLLCNKDIEIILEKQITLEEITLNFQIRNLTKLNLKNAFLKIESQNFSFENKIESTSRFLVKKSSEMNEIFYGILKCELSDGEDIEELNIDLHEFTINFADFLMPVKNKEELNNLLPLKYTESLCFKVGEEEDINGLLNSGLQVYQGILVDINILKRNEKIEITINSDDENLIKSVISLFN